MPKSKNSKTAPPLNTRTATTKTTSADVLMGETVVGSMRPAKKGPGFVMTINHSGVSWVGPVASLKAGKSWAEELFEDCTEAPE